MSTTYKYGADTKFEHSWDGYQPNPSCVSNDLDDMERKLIERTKEYDITEGVTWAANRSHSCVGEAVHGYPDSSIVSVIEGKWDDDGSTYDVYWYIFITGNGDMIEVI